jgi:hypothetical protein
MPPREVSAMRGWVVGDRVTDERGVTGTITGLDAMGAWLNVRGHVTCIAWGTTGMPDREEYDRRRARAELPLLARTEAADAPR